MAVNVGNRTYICEESVMFKPRRLMRNIGEPLKSASLLFMLQLSIISLVSRLFEYLLKYLGQSTIISQIFGGLVFGPSILGHSKEFVNIFFPKRAMVFKTAAVFGLMFFLFTIGVKMDNAMMLRPEPKAMAIGISLFFLTTPLAIAIAFILKSFVPMRTSLANSLIYIAASQALTGFPVIAGLLTELKILNTDIGRLALSSAMFSDLIGISLTAIAFSVLEAEGNDVLTSVWAISSALALAAIIIFVIRPIILRMIKKLEEGKPVDEKYIFLILVFVLVTGFLSEVIGQHYVFGPLILGLVVPDGPPLGVALESKLETLVAKILYPMYLASSGLETNVFKIHLQSLWIVGIVVLFSSIVKIVAVMLAAKFMDIPNQEAFVLGLILNAKGIIELIVFNLLRESKALDEEEFALSVLSVLLVTAIVTPLIRLLYDPSQQYITLNRSSIQHSKRDSDLRIMVCVHHQDNIPTVINLLEVSHASKDSPITAIVMILVELVGRTIPVLVDHQVENAIETPTSTTGRAINALRYYQSQNEGHATFQSFTSTTHFETMHDDICRVASNKGASIVIMPLYKQWAIDGSVGSQNTCIRTLNLNVLEKAPCSVGILIDRGNLSGSHSVLNSQSIFRVAVIFISGPDDFESLAYGSRMARHPLVHLIVFRFLLFGAENTKERKQESDLINGYRAANAKNSRFKYVEEVVEDGAGLARSLRGMGDCFELILVGKHHEESQMLAGLEEWSESPEIGVIGDMLASPDFGNSATVLVMQQQRIGGNNMKFGRKQDVTGATSSSSREPLASQDVLHHQRQPSKSMNNDNLCSISVQ